MSQDLYDLPAGWEWVSFVMLREVAASRLSWELLDSATYARNDGTGVAS